MADAREEVLELTLTCEFVVATDAAGEGMPEIEWDLTPGWAGRVRGFRLAVGARPGMEPDRQISMRRETAERPISSSHLQPRI